jgi:histidinol-phosphate aminotransferase
MSRLKGNENLLVMRTLSKLGLAGLRLGFLAGAHAWLEQFEKLRLPYNIGTLTQASVAFFLGHMQVFDEQAALIRMERDRLCRALQSLPRLHVWPSAANFLLVRSTGEPAAAIHGALRERGLLVKSVHGSHPLLEQCLRVTVGSREENDSLLSALRMIVEN